MPPLVREAVGRMRLGKPETRKETKMSDAYIVLISILMSALCALGFWLMGDIDGFMR